MLRTTDIGSPVATVDGPEDLGSLATRARDLGRLGRAAELIPCSLLPAALALDHEALGSATTALGELGEDLELAGMSTVLRKVGPAWELSGTKPLVQFAGARNTLVIAASHESGPSVVVVDLGAEGVRIEPRPTIGRHHDAQVQFDRVAVSDGDLAIGALEQRLRRATPLVALAGAAAALGALDSLLELCIEQGLNRRQFGRQLGAFQAFQHRCAEIAMERRLAEVLVSRATDSGDFGDALRARGFSGSAAVRASCTAIELNGGKAYLDDHPASLLYREAKTAELRWGSVNWSRKLLAASPG